MNPSTDLAKRETLTVMLNTYTQATQDIETAYAMLEAAQDRLRSAFLDTSKTLA